MTFRTTVFLSDIASVTSDRNLNKLVEMVGHELLLKILLAHFQVNDAQPAILLASIELLSTLVWGGSLESIYLLTMKQK
jgi:hypothetical protein